MKTIFNPLLFLYMPGFYKSNSFLTDKLLEFPVVRCLFGRFNLKVRKTLLKEVAATL